jgi:hypothetical protein
MHGIAGFQNRKGRQLLTCNRYGINFGDCFVRNFTNPYEPQIATLCVLESRSTGLLATGTSSYSVGTLCRGAAVEDRASAHRTGGGLDAMDGTPHWVRGHDLAILGYLRLPLMR